MGRETEALTGDPLVSVIVRTIDRRWYLTDCLKSLERQEHKSIEAIVVNDGGPSLEDFLRGLDLDLSIRLIEFRECLGRGVSGNHGVNVALGKYVAFLDDDDIFYPDHLKILVSELEESEYRVAYTDSLRATQTPCSFADGAYTTIDYQLIHAKDFSFDELVLDNYIPILCVLFEKDCIEKLGYVFDPQLDVVEDWEFWIRLAKEFSFKHVRAITSEYRARNDGTNTQGQFDHVWNWSREYVARKHAGIREVAKRRVDERASE